MTDKKARTLKDQHGEAEIAETDRRAAQGTVSTSKSGIYWLGAQTKEDDRLRFISEMKSRFPNKPENALSYINDISNTIITKAVGLLQYNAVL